MVRALDRYPGAGLGPAEDLDQGLLEGAGGRGEGNPVLRALGPGEARFHRADIEAEAVGEDRIGGALTMRQSPWALA